MNSQQVKQAFKAAGLSVRVADQGLKFRICTLSGSAFDKAAATAVAASLGLTNVVGTLGGAFDQAHALGGYKPGAMIRV